MNDIVISELTSDKKGISLKLESISSNKCIRISRYFRRDNSVIVKVHTYPIPFLKQKKMIHIPECNISQIVIQEGKKKICEVMVTNEE